MSETRGMLFKTNNISQGTVAIEASRAAIEAQGKLMLAKQFPRDYTYCYAKAIEACQRKAFADEAFYAYPKGKETITGPTIRFAEELARCYGNIDYGFKELSRDNGKTEMQAYCWDLETNVNSTQNFTVEHILEKKEGDVALTKQRDIYEKTANDGARRLRSRILAILPPDLVEDCIKECKKTLVGKNDIPLNDRVRKMVVAFSRIGVTKEMLEKRLGHTLESMNAEEIVEYNGIYNSLVAKETTISEWFEQPKTATQMTELLMAAAEQEEKAEKPKEKNEVQSNNQK